MKLEDKKLGLVLSGGGVRGVAHIGAIKALLEYGIEPDIVSGSSAGSVVGALYCNGYSPEQMMEFFKQTPLFHINKFAFSKPGFIDTDKFYNDFKKFFSHDDFSRLKKKLFVTTVDMCEGELKVFESGQLIRPLLASSAFPGLFSPVAIDHILYADGGILDNFPIAPLLDRCDVVIGVYASPLSRIEANGLKYSVNVLERAIRINYSKRSHAKFKHCQLLINPLELVKFGLLDVGKLEEIFQIGYESACEAISKMDSLVQFQSEVKS
ncbi:patatin-like phospholipase family protein [Lutimonas sp.]|jgi:NTE family protein|uniref:patatin-like phospholipase family protein n=1 Tax=Lutimonas sp. TaxID=1872403 RepID=UPI003C73C50B